MAALTHLTGPIDHYVRFRDNSTYYLGTANTAPEVAGMPAYLNVPNDLAGRTYPLLRINDGAIHMVTSVLNRFDLALARQIRDASKVGGLQNPGKDTLVTRGQIMTGVFDFELILVNTYFGTVAATPDLAFGRVYFSTLPEDYKESTVGTKVLDLAFTFRCDNLFDPTTRTFKLYSEAVGDIGSIPAPN